MAKLAPPHVGKGAKRSRSRSDETVHYCVSNEESASAPAAKRTFPGREEENKVLSRKAAKAVEADEKLRALQLKQDLFAVSQDRRTSNRSASADKFLFSVIL